MDDADHHPYDDSFDEALTRFHRTGPEFEGFLSNHGPMAADALVRSGAGEFVEPWTEQYLTKLDELPTERWPIEDGEWRELLGDASRLGDWLAYFERAVREEPWSQVLARWFPRLAPGAVGAATHPLIRTGHAVRALIEHDTEVRRTELAQAIGYWAARWAPLPPAAPLGTRPAAGLLDELPYLGVGGGARNRAAHLDEHGWPSVVESAARPADIPAAIDELVDAAVDRYGAWADASPVMLVHMATAPRAAGLCLAALPRDQWDTAYACGWRTSAAIASMYRPPATDPRPVDGSVDSGGDDGGADVVTVDDVAERAARTGDEHAIKFTEVAIESYRRRGARSALGSALRSSTLLG